MRANERFQIASQSCTLVLRGVSSKRCDLPRIEADARHRAQSVGKDAKQHGNLHGEPYGRLTREMRLLLEINQPENNGREAARAEPTHEDHTGPH